MPKRPKGPKEWAPPTAGERILRRLKEIAPQILFKVRRTVDPGFVWDGEDPDPREEGYQVYDVDVIARAIVNGEEIEGNASMGGHYDMPGDFDPDVAGYLPQMLEEAVGELTEQVKGSVVEQAQKAGAYLKEEMRALYEAHMRRR